jgi:leucyl/phenylalanyl-tRNA---protein transferase
MTKRLSAGELDPAFILRAYRSGFFPMAEALDGAISWYSPDPRAIIPLDGVIVSRSLRRALRSHPFEIRVDAAFEKVVRRCSQRNETWISEPIILAYTELYRQGHAHSVESWESGELVGGLYGVSIGGAFFGESMFSSVTNSSKIAFVHLVQHLKNSGYVLLDSQFINDHVRTLGAIEIPRAEYLRRLAVAVELPVTLLP